MTYTKPELDVKKFNIVEEITADGDSAMTPTEVAPDTKSKSDAGSIGSDLIIG